MTKTFLTAAALAFATPAFAEPVTVIVPTAGYDLSTPEGRAALYDRAARLAEKECGDASAFDLKGKKAVRECRETVMTAVQRHAAQSRLVDAAR
ncbi:UrcA family protein [Sphingomicrobium clamense]|uniref:UrcA family protein n=1 Tax=Sphingomicrobium clamense TaxID=2851013 RepID=A0ABS6V5B9_9SPHN|nr:UrcA family protein [Sphingomicrobium sp. B8]MBW0144738.1 UrcA family protein [Sphingomicrobium sp. B8]